MAGDFGADIVMEGTYSDSGSGDGDVEAGVTLIAGASGEAVIVTGISRAPVACADGGVDWSKVGTGVGITCTGVIIAIGGTSSGVEATSFAARDASDGTERVGSGASSSKQGAGATSSFSASIGVGSDVGMGVEIVGIGVIGAGIDVIGAMGALGGIITGMGVVGAIGLGGIGMGGVVLGATIIGVKSGDSLYVGAWG
jgi:hypothetical protein